jgi:hypothetical protein
MSDTKTTPQNEKAPVDGYYSDEELGFDEDELDLSFLDED